MKGSKLHSILSHFDKYEQNRLRKYIQSPFFNRDETLVILYDVLLDQINKPENELLEKEGIWKKLKLNKPYDDVRFRKYSSDLLKLIEGFLSLAVMEENQLYQNAMLMEAIRRKRIKRLYSSTLNNIKKMMEEEPYKNADYFYSLYQVEKGFYSLTELETKRSDVSNVEQISKNLDFFYLGEKLRLYCEALSRRNILAHNYQILFAEEVINIVKSNLEFFAEIPPIAVYYQIYLIYTEPDNEDHYYKLKTILSKYAGHFPPEVAKSELYMSAQNYCIRKTNMGNQNFLKELFILYREMLDKNIITSDGTLSPWYFKNIVQCALHLKEFDWVEQFIISYKDFLPSDFRDNAYTYSLAQVYFYQKKFDKVIQQLQTVEYGDFTYSLGSKSMLLATYYETDEIEPLFSLFESFRTFLNRNKDFPKDRKESYLNLIKFTKKLTRLVPGDKKTVEKLKEEVEKTPNIASIGWLREKIGELV